MLKSVFTFVSLAAMPYTGLGQVSYLDTISVSGTVKRVSYSLDGNELFDSYVLVLDTLIREVNRTPTESNWEPLRMVEEIHLNALHEKILPYEGDHVTVNGVAFHALTAHHLRDLCVFVIDIDH